PGMARLVRLGGKRPGCEAQTISIFAPPSLDTESRKRADFVELPSAGPTLGFDQCLRMGMARMNRQGGGKLQGARVQRRPIAQGGASEREGAGLVEDDGIDLGQTLQAAAILQQDIAFEEPPGGD